MRYSSTFGSLALLTAGVCTAWPSGAVKVVQLSVDGRIDGLLGHGNSHPTLAWQIVQTTDCAEQVCPADRQTAYNIQVATTVHQLEAGQLTWDSGRIDGKQQQQRYDQDLVSRDTVAWRVRVWDAHGDPSHWSAPSTWTVGLLDQADWGEAHWIEYPDRTEDQPLPLFARQFDVPSDKEVASANLYLSGIALHHATVNGEEITDEVLAPGYSNYQLSSEYRTYDVRRTLRSGSNTIGVRLGNGPAYVRRSVTNPAVGRDSPYAWWQSQLNGNSTLIEDVGAGRTTVQLNNVTGYYLQGTINIDTAGGGDNLESRMITAIDNTTNIVTFAPGIARAHGSQAVVTGSGNNVAASDPSAGAAVTPRLIGRLELTYSDGSSSVITTDRAWRTKLGPLVSDAW